MLGAGIPQLQPWFIGPVVHASAAPLTSGGFGSSSQVFRQVQLEKSVNTSATAKPGSFLESNTDSLSAPTARSLFGAASRRVSANEGTMNSTFDIAGKSNIPSDDSYHKVSIVVSNTVF